MLLLIAVLTYQRAERLVGLELYVGREIWMAGNLILQWLSVDKCKENRKQWEQNQSQQHPPHFCQMRMPRLQNYFYYVAVSVYRLFIVKGGILCFSFLGI